MRTGAAGVIVGVGADSFSTGDAVMGIRVPLASAIADAAAARRDYLDETGGRYVHVIANGRIETSGAIARALACGADAVQLGEPLRIAAEAPGGGVWWDSVAAHPRLPRGGTSAAGRPGAARCSRCCSARPRPPTGAPTCSARCAARWPRPATATSRSSSGSTWSSAGTSSRRAAPLMDFPTVLVVDFGAQYAQLIARRIREAGVYSEIVAVRRPGRGDAGPQAGGDRALRRPVERLRARAPRRSTRRCSRPASRPSASATASRPWPQSLGGTVAHTGDREYGGTPLTVTTEGRLFGALPVEQSVWMSHGDAVSAAPPGFTVTATSTGAPVAAFEDVDRKLAGVQFHPEVRHTAHGQTVLEHFLFDIAGLEPTWTMANVVEEQVERIRAQIGDGRALCALSGGVDSAVAAALVQRAIGDRLTCVYVDHGLMREGETEQIERDFVAVTGVDLRVVDAREQFLGRAGRGLRPRGEAEDHRPGVHPGLRAGRPRRRRRRQGARRDRRLPRAGHALPRRRRVRRRHRDGEHQEPPQRRRPARGPAVHPGRAAADAVQGRGPRGRRPARPARGDGLAPAVPRARASASGSSAR